MAIYYRGKGATNRRRNRASRREKEPLRRMLEPVRLDTRLSAAVRGRGRTIVTPAQDRAERTRGRNRHPAVTTRHGRVEIARPSMISRIRRALNFNTH